MSKQSMGGCKKRKRKSRLGGRINAEERTLVNKANRALDHKRKGHARKRRTGISLSMFPDPERKEGKTFDDEYRIFRKTRGRTGLNPNPDKRKPENPNVLNRDSVLSCGWFPIGELMQNPIRTIKVKR